MATPPPIPAAKAGTKSTDGSLKVILLVGMTTVLLLVIAGGAGLFAWDTFQKKKAKTVADRQAEKVVLDDMATEIKTLVDEMRDENGIARETKFRLKTGNVATTDAERIREVFSGYLNDMASLQNEYIRELDKAGLQQLLEPERIRKDTTLDETRKMLTNCRKLAEDMRQRGLEYFNTFPKRLDDQGFTTRVKEEIMSGYKRGADRSMANFLELWELEISSMDQMEAACEHLHKTRSAWTTEDGQFAFYNDPDLEKFNGYMKKMEENLAKQNALRQNTIDKAIDTLQSR